MLSVLISNSHPERDPNRLPLDADPRLVYCIGMIELYLLSSVIGDAIVKHWAAFTIALTCLTVICVSLYFLNYYVKIILTIFCDTPPPLLMGPVDFARIEGERVRFRSFDGTSLQGMWYHPTDPTTYRGTIVFCHEYGSNMYSFARYTQPLLAAGYSIFAFDFRSHGDSVHGSYHPVQWASDKELGDVLGATGYIETVLREQGQDVRIGLFGISRGAASGLLAAASDPNVTAIVSDSAFDTQRTLVTYMKRWVHIFASIRLIYENHTERFWTLMKWIVIRKAQSKLHRRFPSVARALKDMTPRPIFFIHGKRDSYISYKQTEYLHKLAADPKYHWIVPKAKHNQAVVINPDAYAKRTVAFFDKYLAGLEVDESVIRGE